MTTQPIEISEVAREAARLEINDAQKFAPEKFPLGEKVQLAINSATEKLTAENERLRNQLKKFGSGVDFFSWGKVKAHLPIPLAKQLTLLQVETDTILYPTTTPNQGEQKR